MSRRVVRHVDIAICTWNRCEMLAKALTSLCRMRIPAGVTANVIVVDNNSTDGTSGFLEQFASAVGEEVSVKILKESQQGHTVCRNRAIESATGDLMLWTDDDIIASEDWLERYLEFVNNDLDSSFWGSVIEPEFPAGMPTWISENWNELKGCFADRNLGLEPLRFHTDRLPYGANFAILTEIQKQYPFDLLLGRRGDAVMGEDEFDLFRRLLDDGHSGTWIPQAKIWHQIPASRSSQKYVYDYFVGQGRALVANNKGWNQEVGELKTESHSEFRKYKLKRIFSKSNVWVSHMIRSGLARGQWEAIRDSIAQQA
ncbi:glycosyltransferase family 2 protein [bacterium]|jgi:glucosyl-dolichyl phosphate glucuronosyltransferase|nr:glycosyltransferase family 2 protein [bacterium]